MHTRGALRRLRLALVAATGCAALLVAPVGATTNGRRVHAIGVRTATLVDTRRPTPATPALGLDASPTRTIPVTVWYPARGETRPDPVTDAQPRRGRRFPLIIWAPGNGARAADTPALVRSWASFGYVVVAAEFPVSSRARTNLDAIDDWGAQPEDVRFVIEQMLHGTGIDGSDVGSRAVPLLLVHGDDDPTIPLAQSRTMFERAAGPHALVTVSGGGHSAYLKTPDAETAKTLATATIAFWDATLRGIGGARSRLAALALPGRFDVEIGVAPTFRIPSTKR